jgi:uncharacterized protein (TIGR03435 family)
MGYRFLVSIGIACAALMVAQTPNGHLSFEAASIAVEGPIDYSKPYPSGSKGGPGTADPTTYTCRNCSLADLISEAYQFRSYRMPNRESYESHARGNFQIRARVPEGTTHEQFLVMLQNLLVDRFKLVVHREKKELPTYQLVVAKGGHKLTPSAEAPVEAPKRPTQPPDSIQLPARKWTMERFTKWLEFYAAGPVTDATGLKGEYDFLLWWSFDTLDNPDAGPAMFAALQLQLGLKLESKKAPAEVLVIDHAEKSPTEN